MTLRKGRGLKIPKWSVVPTAADIAAFDGLHCARQYRWAVRHGWRCPCSWRSTIELEPFHNERMHFHLLGEGEFAKAKRFGTLLRRVG
jgi:hypothetical protein